ncbi:hypothetical protein GTZ99_12420 [Novosphingobium sp. FSY-8]|uniref:Rhodanese domain-containing protein n=1 Tax=Novosphingobium ovatum TaxID=1908523 RepID=A0ABW9XFP3_9SPHN|nr:hypothetical protein [Novosphingobium ovatum]NBC37355.1 hypothetical protein [Novosphingobium ovatum]
MAELQTTYTDTIAAAYPGMIANGESGNRISRTCETSAGIGFGKAVFRGSGDHGCVLTQTLTATSAAFSGNTGNGAMGTVTVSAGAKIGVYSLVVIEPGTNAGKFTLTDPDGVVVGTGAVAAAFSAGGLAFTLADGATDFASGDGFSLTVAGNAFLGISIATSDLPLMPGADADEYQQYDNVAILTGGTPIWVTAGGSVTDGAAVFVDSAGDFVASGGIPLTDWTFDTTGADDALVKIVKR